MRWQGVRALVVGIEQYEAGERWRLDGPAADAGRVVRCLLARSVEPSRITLLASPLPGNEHLLRDLGIPVRSADSTTVAEVLTRELPADHGDSLFVHWGGHGVVAGDRSRRLFYADATERDKRNLDLTSLLASLMTTFFPHRHQFLAIDACQNLTSELQYVVSLPGVTLPLGHDEPSREQHVLLAARPGQHAVNDASGQTGVFTRELLSRLCPNNGAVPWPPDAARLASELDDVFTGRRAAGHADQVPMYLWRKTPAVDGLVYTLPVAARPGRLSLDALGALLDAMLAEDELASVPNLQLITLLLPHDIRGAVRYTGVPRTDLLAIINTCRQFTTGRSALVAVLRLGMANPAAADRVLATLDRHWPAGAA